MKLSLEYSIGFTAQRRDSKLHYAAHEALRTFFSGQSYLYHDEAYMHARRMECTIHVPVSAPRGTCYVLLQWLLLVGAMDSCHTPTAWYVLEEKKGSRLSDEHIL